jgi:hypothetical protein
MTKASRLSTLALILLLAACSGVTVGEGYTNPSTDRKAGDKQRESILGPDGLQFGDDAKKKPDGTAGIGVNGFLWRASLDTVAFMPLLSADPFGGVIITDWYAPPAKEGEAAERFKLSVYILTRELRADGIKVAAFRQSLNEQGAWIDQAPDTKAAEQIEDAILTRARELRIKTDGR